MRFPAALARFLLVLFPLTVRGLVFLLLAAGLLTAGIARADLAGLFWGSSFLLFILYALAAGHLFLLSLRRRLTRHTVRVHLPMAGLVPGEENEAVIAAQLPRSFPPGFSVHLSVPLSWNERRVNDIRLRMPHGESQTRLTFRAAYRGVYECPGALLEAHDVLGLTAHRLRLPHAERLTVYPALRPVREIVGLVEQTDESAVDSRRRRRSEELLEARKYYPGDDVRRLNWKIFAHVDELFLRIGEEVPPPESRILFVLDTTSNPLVPRVIAADYLDSLVQSCASIMADLVGRGLEVTFSRPGQRDCRSYDDGSRGTMLAVLAEARWTTDGWAPELPSRALRAVIFSSPGSPGLSRIMSTVQARGWSARLLLQNIEPIAPAAPPRLRDYLFVPREPRRGLRPAVPRKRERAAFSEALAHDIAHYRGAAQQVDHAAEI